MHKTGARKGLIGKLGQFQHGPATVKGSPSHDVTGNFFLGRREEMMNLSQENCLFSDHRYYPRAMGRGLSSF